MHWYFILFVVNTKLCYDLVSQTRKNETEVKKIFAMWLFNFYEYLTYFCF